MAAAPPKSPPLGAAAAGVDPPKLNPDSAGFESAAALPPKLKPPVAVVLGVEEAPPNKPPVAGFAAWPPNSDPDPDPAPAVLLLLLFPPKLKLVLELACWPVPPKENPEFPFAMSLG